MHIQACIQQGMSMYGVCTYPIHNYLLILGTYIPERLLQPPLAIRPSSYMHAALTFAGSWLISQSVFVLFPPIVLPTYLSTLLSWDGWRMQINDKIELHHTITAGGDGSTLAVFAHDRSQRYNIMKRCHVSTNSICDMWLPCFSCTLEREREREREKERREERRARLGTCVTVYLHMHQTSGKLWDAVSCFRIWSTEYLARSTISTSGAILHSTYGWLKNLTVIQTQRGFCGLLKGMRGIKEKLQEGGSGE